jgi:hypothetical protein
MSGVGINDAIPCFRPSSGLFDTFDIFRDAEVEIESGVVPTDTSEALGEVPSLDGSGNG